MASVETNAGKLTLQFVEYFIFGQGASSLFGEKLYTNLLTEWFTLANFLPEVFLWQM